MAGDGDKSQTWNAGLNASGPPVPQASSMDLTKRNTETVQRKLPDWIDALWLSKFRKQVLAWYKVNGRDLPWRRTSDPYQVLVSEIMLQQTQASTVIPYYERFLARFPSAQDLAVADETEVLKYWEGLGYYRRAKSLQQAAGVIVSKHQGIFPVEFDEILSLPGIGRYTAGAVASFSLGQRTPIVEANTQRLYSRLLLCKEDLTSSSAQAQLWAFASSILPRQNPGTLNHAVMDLGSMICKPKSPSCLLCPVNALCPTFQQGLQDSIPRPKKRRQTVEQFEVAVSIQDNQGRILIWRRPQDGWWAGLWDLPRCVITSELNAAHSEFERWFLRKFGTSCELTGYAHTFTHTVTHHRIRCQLYSGFLAGHQTDCISEPKPSISRTHPGHYKSTSERVLMTDEIKWAFPDEIKKLPFNSSGRRMVDWILKK